MPRTKHGVKKKDRSEITDEDMLILAAFVIGAHIRGDVDSHQIVKHSPLEIAETANEKLLRNSSRYRVTEKDVVEVFRTLLNLID